MFYSETILSRRGPLGRVWLAAHMERKLSKSQTLQTDIEQSVDAIMGQEIEVMALRLSGQLLLGVVRIYSRKAKYLLDDCNEALLKIKMAFRPGVVDLTEDQLTVNKTAITLQPNGLGLDLLLPDMNWDMDFEDRPVQRHGHHQAHIDDITLRTTDDFQEFDMNDHFDIGPSDGIGSQDFNDVDLGIHWGDETGNGLDQNDRSDLLSVGESVGVGRDAPLRQDSLGLDIASGHGNLDFDILSHKSMSRQGSEAPFGGAMDIDPLPGIDLGDLGIGFDDLPIDPIEKTPGQTRESSRVSSPLTELPATPPPLDDHTMDITIAGQDQIDLNKPKRKPKDRKQIIDSVTEIQNGLPVKGGRGRSTTTANPLNTDVESITAEQHFLPSSSIVTRLLEIRDDPVAHFLPIQATANGTFFCAAPPGLAPELAALFVRPIQTGQKRKALSPALSPSKRLRLEEIERGRHQDSLLPRITDNVDLDRHTPSLHADFEFGDQSGVVDDYQLEIPEVELALDGERARSVATDRSRLSTPGLLDDAEMSYVDMTCPIAIFDTRHASQGQPEQTQTDSAEPDKHGYSKNTVKALTLIREGLSPAEEIDSEVLSFAKLSHKASRRAAASFFFELLVLGTRDCLQISQEGPLQNITLAAKPKLWEHQHSQGEQDVEI